MWEMCNALFRPVVAAETVVIDIAGDTPIQAGLAQFGLNDDWSIQIDFNMNENDGPDARGNLLTFWVSVGNSWHLFRDGGSNRCFAYWTIGGTRVHFERLPSMSNQDNHWISLSWDASEQTGSAWFDGTQGGSTGSPTAQDSSHAGSTLGPPTNLIIGGNAQGQAGRCDIRTVKGYHGVVWNDDVGGQHSSASQGGDMGVPTFQTVNTFSEDA